MDIIRAFSFHINQEVIIALSVVLYALARLLGALGHTVELGESITITILGKDIMRVERDIPPTQQVRVKIPAIKE